jgi:hypothetical protein
MLTVVSFNLHAAEKYEELYMGTLLNVYDIMTLHLPCQHSVEENTKGPDITRCIVALSLQHFRCYKIGSVTWCHKKAILRPQLFGEPEVTNTQCLWISSFCGIQNV